MSELVVDREVKCHHCGEDCPDLDIRIGEDYFCCYGCKAVNELLGETNMQSHFLEISKKNKRLSEKQAKSKFDFLDTADIQEQIVRFKNDHQSRIVLSLPDIHCSSCIYLLEHLPKLEQGIIKSEINFPKKEATISFDHRVITLKSVVMLLAQIGYPADISLAEIGYQKKTKKSRLGAQIAVAGFCFGNAMLMNMPEYLDQNLLLTEEFKSLFGWINLGLALPVLLFSASGYFEKAWKGLKHKTLNIDVPISLGILTLFARSAFEILTMTGMGYIDSLAGLIFLLLVGKWYQNKTYQALSFERDYSSYFPVSVLCIVDGKEVSKTLKDLKVNDLVIIHNDELLPADAMLVEGNANLDYSFVTGEAQPIQLEIGEKVYAGGRQKGPQIIVRLTREVKTSELVSLWDNDLFAKTEPELRLWVDRLSKYFTGIVILLALSTGAYWWFNDPSLVWNSVTAVLIVACPCALALVLPFTYGHALRILGRHGLYLKNAEVIEALGKSKELVFDKTGTLTEASGLLQFHGTDFTPLDRILLRSALSNSSHPLSQQILKQMPKKERLPIDAFDEKTGKGFSCKIGDHTIKVGSAEWVGVGITGKHESQVHVFIDQYRGYFGLQSAYRSGIFDMLKRLQTKFKLHVLSGDNTHQKARLAPFFDELAFNQKPKDKLDYLQYHTTKAVMIGDGLNDAGALKSAMVGLAVTENIHQFSPACDGILSAEKLNTLPEILTFAKQTKPIIFAAFGLSFLYNIVGMYFAMTGQLTPLISAILMPISSVTVVGLVTLAVLWAGKGLLVRD